jgi:hypothetical protein
MSGMDRYNEDPTFHVLVDMIYAEYERLRYTPSEIRDAAMVAAIRFEMMHIREPRV